ncbi:MAG: ACP phosphodiesterase [Pseudomonadales bacterium]
MNFLAHCLIGARVAGPCSDSMGNGSYFPAHSSEPPDEAWQGSLIAGGFLGDFLKGRVPVDMPAALSLGVRLHRRVDAYSNRAPLILRSCERFPAELRRLAPVFVDIIADHLLAMSWSAHHPEVLADFTGTAYSSIAEHRDWLPESGQQFLDYAASSDLFARYQEWPVVERALHSVARRIRRPELGARAAAVSLDLYQDLTADFEAYFPDILQHAGEWTKEQITAAR